MIWFNARLTRQRYFQIPSDAINNQGPAADMNADVEKTLAILRQELDRVV